jgi:DNA-binding CsgD family transcriptional regulator
LIEVLWILATIPPVAAMIVLGEYSRRLYRARREYEKAKGAVEDIVVSFNRQLKRENERLEIVAYKVEALSSKTEGALNKTEESARRVSALEVGTASDRDGKERMHSRLDEIEHKTRDVLASQEALVTRVCDLEERTKQVQMIPDLKFEGAIPIKREKALAQLTETEVSVLEMLVAEGSKTAPEIKEKLNLSREHTARLMKKLYEEG